MKRSRNTDKKTWYPTLLQANNQLETNSWFDIKEFTNTNNPKELIEKPLSINYLKTYKYQIYPNDSQKVKLDNWFNRSIDVYNLTNSFLKQMLDGLDLKDKNLVDHIVNFQWVRKQVYPIVSKISKDHSINKHCLDMSTKYCVTMYKSAISNYRQGFNRGFEIRDLSYSSRRRNLGIESGMVKNSNGFCVRDFGIMNSGKIVLKTVITKDSIVQYDNFTKKYYIITPRDKQRDKLVTKEPLCGVDIGVRTFATVYSHNKCYEIGTDLAKKKIDKHLSRIDKLSSHIDQKLISGSKATKVRLKYSDKMSNRITDLHNKVGSFLLNRYNTINIGKVSIKKMVSNLEGNLKEITKRRLATLSHFRFREKLKLMSKGLTGKINEIDEYMTSRTCSKCSTIKYDLGSNKIYECSNCNLKIDRDINASINIYTL
jgi:transposase